MAFLVSFARIVGRIGSTVGPLIRKIPTGQLSIADLLFLAGEAGLTAFGPEVARDYALAASRRVRTERELLLSQMKAANTVLSQRDWEKVRAKIKLLNEQLDGSVLPKPPPKPKKERPGGGVDMELVASRLPTPPDLGELAAREESHEEEVADLTALIKEQLAIADGRDDEGVSPDDDPLGDALRELARDDK